MVRIHAKSTLNDYAEQYPEAATQLRGWYKRISETTITSFAEMKAAEPAASVVNVEWVVFDILGGNYRLITRVYYPAGTLYIKDFLTHADYNAWTQERRATKKAEEVERERRKTEKKKREKS